MAIPEAQLDTWSAQGSVQQSKDTYATIKIALTASDTGYAKKDYAAPFLQGSYGNDTNVYADSDVDVIIRLDDICFRDLSRLKPDELTAYNKAHGTPVTYGFADFKRDVTAALKKQYGNDVVPGTKAILTKANGSRRNCDVLVAAQFRRYYSFTDLQNQRFEPGIGFLDSSGNLIENFPKQHSDALTAKHKATSRWLKPTVRVFKNMRNRMIEKGALKEGVAPSYFLEGMLSNVPAEKFGTSYEDTFVNCFNWVLNADKTKLTTASGLHWLVRDNERTSWPIANFDAYMDAARKFWANW